MARFRNLCRELGLSPTRVEQFIARGLFSPLSPTIPGKPRDWTVNDAFALLLFERLYTLGMPAVEANALASTLSPSFHLTKILVAHADQRHSAGGWTHELLESPRDLRAYMIRKGVTTAVVFDVEIAAEMAVEAVAQAL